MPRDEKVAAKPQGLVIVNTGHGKGKTTAALGLLLRAWGRDMKVVMLQFVKASTAKWGEIKAAQKMGVEIIPMGGGFSWRSRDEARDKELAQQCWALCQEKILSDQYNIIILDEMTYAFKYGWLSVAEVIEVLRRRPPLQHVVITGRDAPQELIDFADLVTEMRKIKHPLDQGIRAQRGIEY